MAHRAGLRSSCSREPARNAQTRTLQTHLTSARATLRPPARPPAHADTPEFGPHLSVRGITQRVPPLVLSSRSAVTPGSKFRRYERPRAERRSAARHFRVWVACRSAATPSSRAHAQVAEPARSECRTHTLTREPTAFSARNLWVRDQWCGFAPRCQGRMPRSGADRLRPADRDGGAEPTPFRASPQHPTPETCGLATDDVGSRHDAGAGYRGGERGRALRPLIR